jgi:hypothetical protein
MRPSDFYTIGDVLVKRPEYADPGGVSDCPSGQGPWEVVGFTDGAQRGRVGNLLLLDLSNNKRLPTVDDDVGYSGCYLQLKSTGEHP